MRLTLFVLLRLAGLLPALSQDPEPTTEPRFTFVSGEPGMSWIEEGPGRSLLGGTLVDLTPQLRQLMSGDEDQGLLVGAVVEGSLLARAGLHVGDLLVMCDGWPATRTADLTLYMTDRVVGDRLALAWHHGNERFEKEVRLREQDLPASGTGVPEPVQQRVAVFKQGQSGNTWTEPRGDASEPDKGEPTFVYMPSLKMKLDEMQARLDRLEKALADCVGGRPR